MVPFQVPKRSQKSGFFRRTFLMFKYWQLIQIWLRERGEKKKRHCKGQTNLIFLKIEMNLQIFKILQQAKQNI